MKNLCLITFFLFNSIISFSQNNTVHILLEEGIELHDKGDYKAAIKKYEQVLKIDKDNIDALQELSLSYMTMKEYQTAISYCDKLIEMNAGNIIHAYINKGTALDLMGKYTQSVEVYNEGIKKHPEEFLLHYNLGITYLKANEIKKAENKMYKSLEYNPEHTSSNLMLAYTLYYQKSKVRCMLAFYYFLMLEPRGERAKNAFKLLNDIMVSGVEQEGSGRVNITLSADRDTTDPFYTADLFFTLKAATMYTEEYKKMSEFEKFHSNTKDVVEFLKEKVEETRNDFFVNFYVRFLRDLDKAGHLKTYSYHVSQSSISESAKWIKENRAEHQKLIDWFEQYTSNNTLRNAKPIMIDPDAKKKKK